MVVVRGNSIPARALDVPCGDEEQSWRAHGQTDRSVLEYSREVNGLDGFPVLGGRTQEAGNTQRKPEVFWPDHGSVVCEGDEAISLFLQLLIQ